LILRKRPVEASEGPIETIMKLYNKYLLITLLIASMGLAGCASHRAYFKMNSSVLANAKTIGGMQYIPLEKLCRSYDVQYRWDSYIGTAKIDNRSNEIVLRAGSNTILVNGAHKKMDRPAILSSGEMYVPITFVNKNFGSIVGVKAAEKLVEEGISKVTEGPKI